MSVSWDRDNSTPDTPVVDGSLWRGVAYALGIELCALLVILPLAWGLGWIG